jgi:hypothetical protein
MLPPIVSFAWEAGRSKQVFYVGADSRVHELVIRVGDRSWSHANISSRARATGNAATTFPAQLVGFAWEADRTKQVIFVDDTNHVHELFVNVDDRDWNHADLSTIAPVFLQYMGVGFAWEENRSKHLVYPSGREIMEMSVGIGGRWTVRNLSIDARVPVPPRTFPGFGSLINHAALSAYGWSAGHSQQIAYVGTNGHIHELVSGLDGVFRYADLTARANAPVLSSAATFLAGYAWEEGRSKQVAYVDRGEIHELSCRADADWEYANLTSRTGCPRVSSSSYKRLVGYAWPEARTKQLVYVGDDRHVYELRCREASDWEECVDLTLRARDMASGTAGAPGVHPRHDWFSACAWPEGRTKQVAYVGADANIYELHVGPDGVWRFANLSAVAGADPVRV